MLSSKLRKKVDQLVRQDFLSSPVWEFALDEVSEEDQDETTVRPRGFVGQLDPSKGMFVIRAKFQLSDGTNLTGYLTPPNDDKADLGTVQPVILTDDGQVCFWFGMIDPGAQYISELYARLGKSSSADVFPIRYESDVAMKRAKVEGEIPGFLILEDFQFGRTRVIA